MDAITSTHYRPEIDGLRAIAISGVVLHHAYPDKVPGGYLGVDVFFVISGYLITRLLKSSMEKNTFQYSNFYERRIRRIVPALSVIQLLTSFGTIAILTPQKLLKFFYSLMASNFFVQNFYLWSESGYFDESSQLKPLGHLWSLSIEEQFYLVLPLIMKMIEKKSERIKKVIHVIILVLSVSSMELVRAYDKNLNFFLTTSRVWQLLVGSLITVIDFKHSYRVLNILGLIGMVVPMFLFTPNTPHPSIYTCIPVLSTATILAFANPDSICSPTIRLLGVKPIRILGLISYSLYLVHQPVFSLTRLFIPRELEDRELLYLIGICVTAATVSYFCLEQPFRNTKKIGSSKIWVLAVSQFVSYLLMGFSVIMVLKWNYVKTDSHRITIGATTMSSNTVIKLVTTDIHPMFNYSSGQQIQKKWMIIGDSHALALEPVLNRRLEQKGITLINKINSGCPVLFNFHCDFEGKDTCILYNNETLQELQSRTLEPDVIVLSSFWLKYLQGDIIRNEEGAVVFGEAVHCKPIGPPKNDRKGHILAGYKKSVEQLLKTNHTIVLIYSVPLVGWNPAQRLRQLRPNVTTVSTSYQAFVERQRRITDIFDQIKGYKNLVRIYSHKVFCNTYQKNRCIANKGEVIFYMDDNHLNDNGAKLIIDEIANNLQIKI